MFIGNSFILFKLYFKLNKLFTLFWFFLFFICFLFWLLSRVIVHPIGIHLLRILLVEHLVVHTLLHPIGIALIHIASIKISWYLLYVLHILNVLHILHILHVLHTLHILHVLHILHILHILKLSHLLIIVILMRILSLIIISKIIIGSALLIYKMVTKLIFRLTFLFLLWNELISLILKIAIKIKIIEILTVLGCLCLTISYLTVVVKREENILRIILIFFFRKLFTVFIT